MVISEEDVLSRLNSEDNLANKLGKGNRVNHENAGRNLGDENLHPVVRSVISAAAHLDTAKNVSRNFDVSPQQAHNLKHGRVTGTGEVRDEIKRGKEEILSGIHDKAVGILLKSLNLVDNDEKLKDLKPSSLTNIAKDMAVIINKITPEQEVDKTPKVIIVTAPMKDMTQYNVIEVESAVKE